ncbi:MAG: glycosyltransferase family 2 protein, partial [Candidatus Hadarchaeum sp.]
MPSSYPFLSIVCPVFNEATSIGPFLNRLLPVLDSLNNLSEIVFVNDGSYDDTLTILLEIQAHDPRLVVIDLSRNFGKEAALTCGLDYARGDAVIPIDVDLQDPPELIPEMVRLWQQGFEVVLAQRIDRSSDQFWKRKTASWFYRVHNAIAYPPIPPNVGDFRLMDRKVVDALKTLRERHRFMKGLFAWVGFRQAILPYVRAPREAGKSKFSGWRLWNLALEGITSFSSFPLRIWTYCGLVVAGMAFILGLIIVVRVILFGRDVPGYASLITVMLFMSGIQIFGLGMLGEYLGRVYGEVKERPIYVVRRCYISNMN